jgi:hypothetical protein
MDKMRRTEHQRKVDAAEAELEAMIQVIALEELNRLFRGVQLKLRRINQYRPKAHPNHTRLTKADVTGTSLWDLFRGRLRSRLLEALLGGSITLYDLLSMRVADTPLTLDTDAIARELEYQVGERITQVTNTIKREVGRRIVAWYNSPGMPMQTIINQLRPAFGINRAALIATTEITDLHSRVQDRIMADVGLDEWWVNTKRDQLVCTRQIEGPDGQIYQGCRALHGKRFKRGQKMPPFHCNCRCSSVIAVIKPTTPTETPIIDTSHLVKADFVEGEHPRDKGGEFTSKGGEGAGGKMEKPVKVVRSETKEGEGIKNDDIKNNLSNNGINIRESDWNETLFYQGGQPQKGLEKCKPRKAVAEELVNIQDSLNRIKNSVGKYSLLSGDIPLIQISFLDNVDDWGAIAQSKTWESIKGNKVTEIIVNGNHKDKLINAPKDFFATYDLAGMITHEIGHRIEFEDADTYGEWFNLWRTEGVGFISKYATSHPSEGLAEFISLVSSPGFDINSLPKPFLDFYERRLK